MINKKEDKLKKNNCLSGRRLSPFAITFFSLFVFSCLLFSCRKTYVPRPYGYFRVTIPEHNYKSLDTLNLPYKFEISTLTKIKLQDGDEPFWIDIIYPMLNAKIHCSYKPVQNNLLELSEDARRFAYAHSNRSDGIVEIAFENPEEEVFGIFYDIKGNVASPVQLTATDSVRRFFRGALYFENVPNKDSIAPMLDYVREDMIHLMETFEWTR